MPSDVKRLPDEQIVVAKLFGHITLEDMTDMFAATDALFEKDERIFRITDVREAESSFTDILQIIRAASQKSPGSSTDPRIKSAFVGRNTWARLAREALNREQFGNIDLPIFIDFDDALSYMRRLASESDASKDSRHNETTA